MNDSTHRDGQAGAEIEVTPEMIEAGFDELRIAVLGEDLREIAQRVFYAMMAAKDLCQPGGQGPRGIGE